MKGRFYKISAFEGYRMLPNGGFFSIKCAYLNFLTKLPPPILANSLYICTVKKQNKVLEKANDEAKTSK